MIKIMKSNVTGSKEKGDDLQKELERMYVRTEHWISDSAFFADEFKFLFSLMDKYFVGLVISDSTRLEMVKSIARRLQEIDSERESLEKENTENLSYIARLIKNEEAFEPTEFKEAQSDIESDQVDFLKKYRAIKKEIFQLAEQLIGAERTKHLLAS